MYFVSSCLIGDNVKYNGFNNYNEKIFEFLKDKEYLKICPEMLGGLSAPREPCEILGTVKDVLSGKGKVINKSGIDVTSNFIMGAKKVLELALKYNPELVILKARSPSCGKDKVYDGTFSSNLIDGNGVTAQILIDNGFNVVNEDFDFENRDWKKGQ